MRRRSRRTSSRRRPEPGGGVYWVFVILGLGLLGWIWWRSIQPPEGTSEPAQRPKAKIAKQEPERPPALVPSPKPGPTNEASTNGNSANTHPTNATPSKPAPSPKTNAPPPLLVENGSLPRPVQTPLEAQLALARLGISAGSLDGVIGSQTRAALRVYQAREHLPITGQLDETTRDHLSLTAPPTVTYRVSMDDLCRLHPVPRTWLGKSQQSRLDYQTILELVSEKSHSHPDLVRRLNPGIDWRHIEPGVIVQLPDAVYPSVHAKAARVKIHLGGKSLEAFDASGGLLVHFPCSIAAQVEKRPVGELVVTVIVHNPSYVFNPEMFPESEEGRILGRKLILPPGPNNPVGTAWIGLNKSGYGIHGTPRPEEVGRTESHGCFRLANWNAEYLAQLVSVGTPVFVEP